MLKFLIIVIAIFLFFRIFGRMIVVSSFKVINKKMQDEMQRHQAAQNKNMPEGHITIDPGVKKQQKRDDDDYVDYEEVK